MAQDTVEKRFGRAVRAARTRMNITQHELAFLMGEFGFPVHQTAIAKIEAGTRTSTSIGEANALAAITQVPVEHLFEGNADQSEDRGGSEWATFRKAGAVVRIAQASLYPAIDDYLSARQKLFIAADDCVALLEHGTLEPVLEDEVRNALQEVFSSSFDGGLVAAVQRRVESAERRLNRSRPGGIGEHVVTYEVLPLEADPTAPREASADERSRRGERKEA